MTPFLTITAFVLAKEPPAPGLRTHADRANVVFGSCAPIDFLMQNQDNGKYSSALTRNFNLVEPENDFKPPAIWLGVGHYNYSKTDFLLGAPGKTGWAQKNNLKVRGHVLVYAADQGYTIPGWLLAMESKITADQAKSLLREYILDVAGRYKGKIHSWDVINEAIDDRPNDRKFNLKDSFWYRKLGPEFIVLAFKYAREADPHSSLYYNDYGIEAVGTKSKHLFDLVDYLQKEGAPIHGVGMQYHTYLQEEFKEGDGHHQMIDEIGKRGLKFMVTELDFRIPVKKFNQGDPNYALIAESPALLKTQAERYETILKMAYSYKHCEGVNLWGVNDKYSWIRDFFPGTGAPLLFDQDYKEKPAYFAVEDLLKKMVRRK